jgi:hypothetical protein
MKEYKVTTKKGYDLSIVSFDGGFKLYYYNATGIRTESLPGVVFYLSELIDHLIVCGFAEEQEAKKSEKN